MKANDTLKALEGEPEIPSLMPRSSAASHKPIIAVSVLALSLVGVLGFAATRYFGKKEAPPEAAVDVASATVPKLKFQIPPAVVPSTVPVVKAIPVVDQTRVPSIEADLKTPAAAIPVRGTVGGQPTKSAVPVGDESPFGPTGAGTGSNSMQQGDAVDPSSTVGATGMAGEAQANLRRYQSQLGNMLGQLQGLTDKAAGGDGVSSFSVQ